MLATFEKLKYPARIILIIGILRQNTFLIENLRMLGRCTEYTSLNQLHADSCIWSK